ncbi:MAG: FHA domain-containing protein [Collinsella stercoris]|uniref:FHA domain-containing protein n=1 Tax=Collinsella stercoris TaxID=147206 RepID=UPI003994CDDC
MGRDPSNTIFLNDMTVSRSHAKILRNAASVLIEDLAPSMAPGLMAPSSTRASARRSSVQIGTFTLMYHESTVERPKR